MVRRRKYDFADEDFLARLERLHLIAKRLAGRGQAGIRRSRGLGDGLEFADHRDYSLGDDIRFIDWPYYARMERLLLRMFHEHSEADVVILLDTSASMAPGGQMDKFHYSLRAAAALAYVAMGSLERVILQPFGDALGDEMHCGRNRKEVLQVLDFLGGLASGGRTDLGGCVDRLLRRRSAGGLAGRTGTVVLISDLMDCGEALSDALARLVGAGGPRPSSRDVTVLHVHSPADGDPPLRGPVLLEQAETRQRLALNVTDEMRLAYRRRFEAFVAGCQRTCLSRGATYATVPTTVPVDELVLHTLRRAGVIAG